MGYLPPSPNGFDYIEVTTLESIDREFIEVPINMRLIKTEPDFDAMRMARIKRETEATLAANRIGTVILLAMAIGVVVGVLQLTGLL